MTKLNIGIFVSQIGYDGVSHEALKKRLVLERMGHNVYMFTGHRHYHREEYIIKVPSMGLDAEAHSYFEFLAFPHIKSSSITALYPELKEVSEPFQEMLESHDTKLDKSTIITILDTELRYVAVPLKRRIETVLKNRNIDLLIIENIFSIPMQLPLAIALTQIINEKKIPTIAVHHDFWWERERFRHSLIPQILEKYYPPTGEHIKHIVINSVAKANLQNPETINFDIKPAQAIQSEVLPNVFDFEKNPDQFYEEDLPSVPVKDPYNKDFRKELGFDEDDIILLQNTRIVKRKSIEKSVDLLVELKKKRPQKKFKLLIPHKSVDEGDEYYQKLIEYIKQKGLRINVVYPKEKADGDVIFLYKRIDSIRRTTEAGVKIYHYLDPYPYCDFCCFPSSYEGWGNALGEAVQAKKPVLVNKYPIYISDIRQHGFKFIEMSGDITEEVVEKVLEVLENPEKRKEMVEHNFNVGKLHFGLDQIEKAVGPMIKEFTPLIEYNRQKPNQE